MKNNSKIPYHIAIIADGNRRWASKNGLSLAEGYSAAYDNLRRFTYWCKDRGVSMVTFWGFSMENWKRPKEEVDFLMFFFEKKIKEVLKDFIAEGIKIKVIGCVEKLPKSLINIIEETEEKIINNKNFFINLAVSYSGKWDIVEAVKKIIKENIPAEKVTEDVLTKHLCAGTYHFPDLVIRTGGEQRLSNFLLWHIAYSELVFLKKLWPDFTEEDLDKALKEYSNRLRRFGA